MGYHTTNYKSVAENLQANHVPFTQGGQGGSPPAVLGSLCGPDPALYAPLKKSTQTANLHDWALTGRGMKGQGCGKLVFLGCLNKHAHPEGKNHIKVRAQSCNKLSCPQCYMKAAIKEAHRAVHRFKQFYDRGFRPYKYLKHIVASVPKDEYELDFKDMKENARRALKLAGVEGGLLIFHPARWYGKTSNDYYYSPHFHVVGHGWIENTEDVYKLTGWIVHNLGIRKSVVGTISYILSHAGVREKTHTSSWFGSMSYNKFHSKPEPEFDELCPYCKSELKKLRLTRVLGEGEGPPFVDGWEGLTDLDCFVVDTRTWRDSNYNPTPYNQSVEAMYGAAPIEELLENVHKKLVEWD